MRLSEKWGIEVVLFSYVLSYKNNIKKSTDNICLYIDDSATSETTCNYTGTEDLEEGPRLLILKGMQGSEGVSNMKYEQKRQSEKARHMRGAFLREGFSGARKEDFRYLKNSASSFTSKCAVYML